MKITIPNQRPILETVAKILVVDPKDNCLILTLGEHKLYPEKSFMPDLPGGLVDPGESERQAVVRELKEECGVAVNEADIQLVYAQTIFSEHENKSITKLLYIVRINTTPDVTLSWEHSAYAWIALSGLLNVEFRQFYKEALKYTLANKLI